MEPRLASVHHRNRIIEILLTNPKSAQLNEIVAELGYKNEFADILRKVNAVKEFRHDVLFIFMENYRRKWIQQEADSYLANGIEQQIVENTLCSAQPFLSRQPNVVKLLEQKFNLPITGDFDELLENYAESKYTSRWHMYGHDLNFCLEGAARWNHVDVVMEMLERGAFRIQRALDSSIRGNHISLFHTLLQRGGSNLNGSSIYTLLQKECINLNCALLEAARCGNVKIFLFLLDHPAREIKERSFENQLHYAVLYGREEIVKIILSRHTPTDDKIQDLIRWANLAGHFDIAKLLYARIGTEPFFSTDVAKHGRLDIIREFHSVNPIPPKDDRWSDMLGKALAFGHTDTVEYILQTSELNLESHFIVAAAENGFIDMIERVARNSYYHDVRDFRKAFYNLCSCSHVDAVNHVYDLTSDIYDPNQILISSAEGGLVEFVEMALAKGANKIAEALNTAATRGQFKIVQMLSSRCTVEEMNTALCSSIFNERYRVAKYLLDHGAKVAISEITPDRFATLIRHYVQ